nr:hypothetical protein [Tanacetum cinerariifolium]
MSSYEVIVNGYYGMPMDPLDPYVQLVMGAPPSPDYIPGPEAPPSPDYIPGPEAPPSPDYIPGPKYPGYLPPADDMLLVEEQPLHAAVSPIAESPGYITESKPEMEPEENDGDDENSVSASEETEPFEEESEVERLLAIPTPPLSPVSPTSYPLPPFLMPLPIFTQLPTSSFPLPSSIPSTSSSESIPEADLLFQKRALFTTPTSRYEIGESSVAATAARQIRHALTIADKHKADDKLIGRLRRERRYFRTLATT